MQTRRTTILPVLAFFALLVALSACTSPAIQIPTPAPATPSTPQQVVVPDASPAAEPAPTEQPMPPAEPSPEPDRGPVDLFFPYGRSPERPTPSYFEPAPEPLAGGIITDTPPAITAQDPGDPRGLLYLQNTLHIWHPDLESDQDLGWPTSAMECAWLAPDGETLYFSDEEGAKRLSLTDPQLPELLVAHFTEDENPARHRRFCAVGLSDVGDRVLLQARDSHWYQWGVLDAETGTLRVVESPFGPPGEPWYCPGAAAWGQDDVLFVTGYSAGRCSQFPGFHLTRWGEPLVPTAVLTKTLPPLGDKPRQRSGAWSPVRSPDGSQIAFWFDEDWAREDGRFFQQALYVAAADGSNLRRVTDAIPGVGGQPAWSADSQSLFYTTSEPFDTLDPHPWQIHRLDLASGESTVVADLFTRQILFMTNEQDGWLPLYTLNDEFRTGLHLLDLEAGELIHGPANAQALGWLPS